MNFQVSYRPTTRLALSGNYTLGQLKGSTEGENGGSGPTTATTQIIRYPEYYRP